MSALLSLDTAAQPLDVTSQVRRGDPFLSTRQLRVLPSAMRFYRLGQPLPDPLIDTVIRANAMVAEVPKRGPTAGFQAFLPPEELQHRTGDQLALDAAGYRGLRFMSAERKVAPATLKRAIAARISQFTALAKRPPQGREKTTLESEVLARLLPMAPIEETEAIVVFDPTRTRMAVEARTPAAADKLIAALRSCFGSLPCEPAAVAMPPDRALTEWLTAGVLPGGFTFGSKVTLRASDKQSAALSNHDLGSSEVHEHIASGKMVQQIELLCEPLLSITVSADAGFTSLRPLQPVDKRHPTSPEEALAIAERVWPAIFAAARDFFGGLAVTHAGRSGAGAARQAPMLEHASAARLEAP